MKLFVICPVRDISDNYRHGIEAFVSYLEKKGHEVYYPARDTLQTQSPLGICFDNRYALETADEVYILWDGKSQGVLFDAGMAFMSGKRIHLVTGYMPPVTPGVKSFQSMFYQWEEEQL